jgi:hypothetical protein
MRLPCYLVITCIFAINVAAAGIIRIPDDYETIQEGINFSASGDTVLVAEGIYVENIDFLGREIIVKSETGFGGTVIQSAVFDQPVVAFASNESHASVLEGFTITGADGAAGIEIWNASPIIRNNFITDNEGGGSSYSEGGGVYCNSSSAIIRGNIISNNVAETGGGISAWYCEEIVVDSNVVEENLVPIWTGGIRLIYCTSPLITHNLVYNNIASTGAVGISVTYTEYAVIANNTVDSNDGPTKGAICISYSYENTVVNNIVTNNIGSDCYGIYRFGPSTATVNFCDVYNNEPEDYYGFNGGEGSISADPLFVGGEPFSFELTDDSPCIDAGDPDSPLDPDGTIADMGAYYFSQLTTGFGLDMADVYGESGQPAEIPVFAYGLQDQMIAGVEFHIAYDDVCLEFADVSSDYLTDPLINVADGVIHLLWEDYQDPVTVPDSASIIEMDFTVLGGLGDSCLVQWTGNNEIVDPEGEVIADLDWLDGSVFVVEFHDISGNIVYYDLTTPVPDVTIDLAGDFDGTTVSDGNGAYIFEDIIPGDFTVCPSRGDDDVGVTVTDIVLIRRHIVWLEIFDSPYKLVAADVNNSGGVTVADVIKMRRYLADLEELPGGNWAFVDSSFAIDDGNWADAPGCLEATLWDMDLTDSSFVGIRMGDVDFSWAQGRRGIVPPKVTDTAVLDLADCYGLPGDTIYMPINVAGFDGVAGLEMHIEYPEDGMRFVEIGSDVVDDPTTNGQDGAIHFIWEDIFNVVHLGDGDEVAHVAFEILEGAEDSMLVSFTAAYVVDEEGLDFAVESSDGYVLQQQTPYDEGGNVIPRFYRLGQNYPNPFNARTMIDFDLPRSSQVTIEIYDMLGRRAEILANDFLEAGYHQIIWDAADQPSGIYFYRIKAADFADCKKMLLLK